MPLAPARLGRRQLIRRRQRLLVIAAIVLTGLTMRVAVTSVGAVLDDLQDGPARLQRRWPAS